MAITYTPIIQRMSLGDKFLSVYRLTGDGSTTNIAVSSVGLSYAESAWLQNVDETDPNKLSNYSGTTLTTATAISNGAHEILFAIGH